jgi:hypothetical protein
MPELTDAQLGELITAIGLTEKRGRTPAPCGTASAYTRHVKRGEPIDEACRQANTEAKRTKGTPTPARRKPIAHGTPRGAKQHRYRGEPLCDPCHRAEADYQREWTGAKPRTRKAPEQRTYLTEEEWQARVAARRNGGTP